ncbi:metal-dependent hydrolase [Haloplanus salinus]|nr:metal-dependent hydrolase [Haloplanus salinus]
MLPTHAIAGMVLALPVAYARPEFAAVALVAGFVGGAMPDLDLYAGHRKTLHYPVYGPPLAAAALLVAAWQPTAATVGVAVALAAAALHSLADVLGGGLELRPWEATSERAVYDHHRSRWLAPRRWVRYDGSPRDLLLAVALAAPLLVTLDAPLRVLVFATLAVAVGYTAVRRVLPGLAVFVVDRLLAPVAPGRAFAYVPARYRERTGGDAPADGSS